MYRIYVNYNDEVITEYDMVIAYRIIDHLRDTSNLLIRAVYVDVYGTEQEVGKEAIICLQ